MDSRVSQSDSHTVFGHPCVCFSIGNSLSIYGGKMSNGCHAWGSNEAEIFFRLHSHVSRIELKMDHFTVLGSDGNSFATDSACSGYCHWCIDRNNQMAGTRVGIVCITGPVNRLTVSSGLLLNMDVVF